MNAARSTSRIDLAWVALLVLEVGLASALAVRVPLAHWTTTSFLLPSAVEYVLAWNAPARWLFACLAIFLWRRRALRELLAEDVPQTRALPALALHVLSFSVFVALTLDLAARMPARGNAIAWHLAAVFAIFSGGFAYLMSRRPLRVWRRVVALTWEPALIGAVIADASPAANRGTELLWYPLARPTLQAVALILRAFTPNVVLDAAHARIGTSSFAVTVFPACAGYEGIGLMTAWVAVYLVLFRRDLRFPRAFVLLPVGAVLIWTANAIRIALLIAVGTLWSRDVAIGGFHSQLGWILFNLCALGLVAASHRSTLLTARAPLVAPSARASSAPLLVPLFVLMSTLLLTSMVPSRLDVFYGVRVVAVAVALAIHASTYRTWPWSWSWRSLGLGVLAYGIWIALEPRGVTASELPGALAEVPRAWRLVWIGARVAGSIAVVPLAEELAFRGYLLPRLQTLRLPTWLALVLSSVTFGALHHRWLAGALAGMIFGIAFQRQKRVSDAVLAHATANALIAVHVLAGGRWGLWS